MGVKWLIGPPQRLLRCFFPKWKVIWFDCGQWCPPTRPSLRPGYRADLHYNAQATYEQVDPFILFGAMLRLDLMSGVTNCQLPRCVLPGTRAVSTLAVPTGSSEEPGHMLITTLNATRLRCKAASGLLGRCTESLAPFATQAPACTGSSRFLGTRA